jgi:hypothetical protein
MSMKNAKKTLPEIRGAVDQRYGKFGPSTPTPRPPA